MGVKRFEKPFIFVVVEWRSGRRNAFGNGGGGGGSSRQKEREKGKETYR